MKKWRVHILGSPSTANTFIIEGENLIEAVKRNFYTMVEKSSYGYMPFRYPMTVTPSYNKGILGGQGGVELKLEWMYSNHTLKPETLHTHSVLVYASKEDLTDAQPFVMGQKRDAKVSIGKAGGTAGGKAANYKISLPTKWVAEMGIEDDARDVEMTFVDGKIVISKKQKDLTR